MYGMLRLMFARFSLHEFFYALVQEQWPKRTRGMTIPEHLLNRLLQTAPHYMFFCVSHDCLSGVLLSTVSETSAGLGNAAYAMTAAFVTSLYVPLTICGFELLNPVHVLGQNVLQHAKRRRCRAVRRLFQPQHRRCCGRGCNLDRCGGAAAKARRRIIAAVELDRRGQLGTCFRAVAQLEGHEELEHMRKLGGDPECDSRPARDDDTAACVSQQACENARRC